MQILTSFCFRGQDASCTFAAVDSRTLNLRPLLLTNGPPEELAGLAADAAFVYVAARRPAALIVLERPGLGVIHRHSLPDFDDLHSLALRGSELFAVSTGTDEVVCLSLEPPHVVSECVLWRPKGSLARSDHHHLNSLCFVDDELHVSGFGRKRGDQWATAIDGFILNVERSQTVAAGIHHPHSLLPLDNGIAFCESGRMTVHLPSHSPLRNFPGYTRGLCRVGDHVLVGASTRRKASRTSGKPVTSVPPIDTADRCSISVVSLRTGEVVRAADLSGFRGEIYDFLPVEEEIPANVKDDLNFHCVDHMDQVISLALLEGGPRPSRAYAGQGAATAPPA